MALPKIYRLSKSSLISTVNKKGASWKTPFFRIRHIPSRNNSLRIVVIPSKKYLDPRAVYRNKARRKILGAIEHIGIKNIPKKMMLIYPSEKIFEVSFPELVKTLKFSFRKIH